VPVPESHAPSPGKKQVMRHRVAHRKLGRVTEHRIAMLRNQAISLLRHEHLTTTVPRAKELRPFVERLITVAKRGHARHRETLVRPPEVFLLLENGFPGEAGLVDLEQEPSEQLVVIIEARAIYVVVIDAVHVTFRAFPAEPAVRGHYFTSVSRNVRSSR